MVLHDGTLRCRGNCRSRIKSNSKSKTKNKEKRKKGIGKGKSKSKSKKMKLSIQLRNTATMLLVIPFECGKKTAQQRVIQTRRKPTVNMGEMGY